MQRVVFRRVYAFLTSLHLRIDNFVSGLYLSDVNAQFGILRTKQASFLLVNVVFHSDVDESAAHDAEPPAEDDPGESAAGAQPRRSGQTPQPGAACASARPERGATGEEEIPAQGARGAEREAD